MLYWHWHTPTLDVQCTYGNARLNTTHDAPITCQVKTMKDEKQELLRIIEELRAENGNLQVRTVWKSACQRNVTSRQSFV